MIVLHLSRGNLYSSKKKNTDATYFSNQVLVNHYLFSPNRLFTTYPASCVVSNIAYSPVTAVVSSHAVSMAVSLATASAVADTISAVLALGHLLGLSVSDTEIADGHDAATLAARLDIGTLFLAAE